ncbi:MAG: hypothetical protein E7620_06100 [Ruminococcaceae bacterium]|nr:hypothetical protein [Oscillospiraceae bacterium]
MARYKAPRIMGYIFKALATLFVFGVCGILVWRVFFSTAIPKEIEVLQGNERLSAAYATAGDGLTMQYQELGSITRAPGSMGYFSVVQCVFIPEAEQVQVVFRYNNSTIRHLQEDYKLASLPEKSSHLFDVTLVKTTDLTPNDHNDDLDESTLSSSRIQPTGEPLRAETALYTYYRYVFDGVTVEEITDAVYVDVYYVQDIRYEEKPYGSLLIYAWDEDWIAYKPTRADLDAIKQ